MSRARHEVQITLLDSVFGREFDRALSAIVGRRRRALEFFTDEQIAEIREEMIRRDWQRHKILRENRRRAA